MTQPGDPHDKLFRALLDDPERARLLLREHLPPDIVTELADDAPEPVEGSFVDAALQGSQSDRLFRVSLKDGRAAYIYTLLEHKSAPDPRTPIQMLTYLARIWDRHCAETGSTPERLPAIIPLVIYHGRRPWRVPTSVLDAIDAPEAIRNAMAGMRYILRDLGPMDDAELAADRVLRAGLAALKHAFDQGVPLKVVVSLLADTPDRSLIERQVLEYVVRVYDLTERDLTQALDEAKPDRREELMGTVAEEWMKQGEARGHARGIAEGKAAAMAESVLRILRGRFGDLDDRLTERIRGADRDTLDAMLDRALTVDRPEDVLYAGQSQ
jgi:predicted transposase/invertase (TIGR01784 family)